MANDWYPSRLADLPEWWANFSTVASAQGVADGLSAGQVTQISADAPTASALLNYRTAVDGFAEAYTEYMRIMLTAPLNTPLPLAPTPPDVIDILITAQPAMEARARLYAGILKAHPLYTLQKGELYRIVPPASPGPGTPAINSAAPQIGSTVLLALFKAGYSVLAVDMRRDGGLWGQIGIAMTANFTDSTAPLVPGAPEVREYRVQGMANSARVGSASAIVSVVTTP